MALMSLRSRSHVNECIDLTRADNICIQHYIRSLLNIKLRPISSVRMGLEPAYYYPRTITRVSDAFRGYPTSSISGINVRKCLLESNFLASKL